MANINYNPGPTTGSLHSTTKMRIEQIARMRLAGIKDPVIAELLKITTVAFKAIVQMPEYKQTEEALLLGHLTEMDKAIAGKVEVLRSELRSAVPAALRCLVDAVSQRRDLRTALAAAGEILDRDPDGTFVGKNQPASEGLPSALLDNTIKEADQIVKEMSTSKVN